MFKSIAHTYGPKGAFSTPRFSNSTYAMHILLHWITRSSVLDDRND